MSGHKQVNVFHPDGSFSRGNKSFWGGLYGSAKALAIANLLQQANKPVVILVHDLLSVSRMIQELHFYLNKDAAFTLLTLPDWETLPYDLLSPYQDIVSQRLATLSQLPSLDKGALIVSVTTLMHRLMPKDFLLAHNLVLQKGQKISIDVFRKQLDASGYTLVNQVTEHGDVSIRGSLIDVYPMGGDQPYRIDFLDTEIDSIRSFDVETQRSLNQLTKVNLLPAKEVVLTDKYIAHFKSAWKMHFDCDPDNVAIYKDVSQGIATAGIEYYLPLFYEKMDTLFDYLPHDCITILDEDITVAAKSFCTELEERYAKINHETDRLVLPPKKIFLNLHELLTRLKPYRQIHITRRQQHTNAINYNTTLPVNLRIDARSAEPLLLFKQFANEFDGRILLIVESNGRREVLLDMLRQHYIKLVNVESWSEFMASQHQLALTVTDMEQGVLVNQPNIALISEAQLFGEQVMQRRLRKRKQQDSEKIIGDLSELTIATPVVHEQHGVGRYQGLVTLKTEDMPAEFIVIEYAEGDKLYVPIAALNIINRFSGIDTEHAPLHRLGSKQWEKAKRKASKRIHDVAAELLELHAQREARFGFEFTIEESAYQAFAQGFRFEETPGQIQVIDEMINDMRQAKPMDRLVCGDAGFGKTEVAMRAAFIAVQNNKQVAIFVPTTLLAQQHYENFQDRFADWPISIGLLSRFLTDKQQNIALAGIRDGKTDIIIGTHKLLQNNIKFANLGLLIIDEEHRFGVRQKERLKGIKANIDILTLTATPIPRTLNMALSGIRDFSIITTPPAGRLPVITYIHQWDNQLIREAILREIRRGGQVYILHNVIETIEKTARQIQSLVEEGIVRWAHGQMSEKLLEQVMHDFYHHHFNILVCTTIIETGIDIPSANTIVINRADKFGLAQIYQLRGRVGRSHHRAYAYLMIPDRKLITADAIRRLEAVEALQDLGIGFTLATHDLEIRGAGEILGAEQSGQIKEIGYGLYMELLDRAVAALKSGQQPSLEIFEHSIEVNLHIAALIPEDYLVDVHMRLTLYKRIASAKGKGALQELKVEMIDRFGLLPQFANNLFHIAELKLLAASLGICKIDLGEHGGKLQFKENNHIDTLKIINLIEEQSGTYSLYGKDTLRINKDLPEPAMRLELLTRLMTDIKINGVAN